MDHSVITGFLLVLAFHGLAGLKENVVVAEEHLGDDGFSLWEKELLFQDEGSGEKCVIWYFWSCLLVTTRRIPMWESAISYLGSAPRILI